MTLREKVEELVEEIIDEPYLPIIWETQKLFNTSASVEIDDIVSMIESLAFNVMQQKDDDSINAEPQFDTLGEARGER